MSYIPDFRHETGKLNEKDQAYVQGYRNAVEDVLRFLEDAEELSLGEGEREEVKEQIAAQMELEEIEMVCSLFDHADYLPDDTELTDGREPIYRNTKGGRMNGEQ